MRLKFRKRILSLIVLFNAICIGFYLLGFGVLGEDIPTKEFVLYHGMQIVMEIEIAGICYAVSAFSDRNRLGFGLGVVLLFYAYDLMARVIPDLSDYNILSPFSYANASDIFSSGELSSSAFALGMVLLLLSLGSAFTIYNKRDLAA